MKKIVVLLGLVTIMLVSGCSNEEKLTCTKTGKETDYVQEQKMTTVIKNEKIKKMTISSETNFLKSSDDEIEDSYDMIKNAFSSIDKEGIDVNTSLKKKTVLAEVIIDFDKAKEEDIKQFTSTYSSKENNKISVDSMKKEMIEQGYTCK